MSNQPNFTQAVEHVQRLQKVVNDFLATDYREYVLQHKMKLIDSRFAVLDRLLDEGILYLKPLN